LDEQQIISQYADDSSLTLRGEEATVVHTVSILDTFTQATGLLINQEKSCAYWWSRRHRPRPHWTYPFKWHWA
jgi:hypothetical protein